MCCYVFLGNILINTFVLCLSPPQVAGGNTAIGGVGQPQGMAPSLDPMNYTASVNGRIPIYIGFLWNNSYINWVGISSLYFLQTIKRLITAQNEVVMKSHQFLLSEVLIESFLVAGNQKLDPGIASFSVENIGGTTLIIPFTVTIPRHSMYCGIFTYIYHKN